MCFRRFEFDQHRECRGCTHAGDVDSDSDGPPELDWTHSSEDEGPPGLHPSSESENERESQDERESPTHFGDIEPEDLLDKAIARNSVRETLLVTCVEIIALQAIDEMRLQSQSTVDNSNVIHPHGLIDESRVGTDDGSRGGGSRSRRHSPPRILKPRSRLLSIMIENDKSEDLPLVD